MIIGSLNSKLRDYFSHGLFYSVNQLSVLTDTEERYIRVMISRLKNPKFCGKEDDVLDLIQDIGKIDKIKRWGIRGAKGHAKIAEIKGE